MTDISEHHVLQTHQLLLELGAMQAKDPKFKAVVSSSWGRLLRLIEEALAANGISHVSLAGTQPEKRASALRTFLNDPNVSCSCSLCCRHAVIGFFLDLRQCSHVNDGLSTAATAMAFGDQVQM